jgi:hypothetical protein
MPCYAASIGVCTVPAMLAATVLVEASQRAAAPCAQSRYGAAGIGFEPEPVRPLMRCGDVSFASEFASTDAFAADRLVMPPTEGDHHSPVEASSPCRAQIEPMLDFVELLDIFDKQHLGGSGR